MNLDMQQLVMHEKKKQNINNQFLESLTMASKGKTYFRMKELMSNEKTKPVADLFYDIAMNQTNVSEMVRNHKKREKHIENKKYDYLMDKFKYCSDEYVVETSSDEHVMEISSDDNENDTTETSEIEPSSDDNVGICELAGFDIDGTADHQVNVNEVLESMFELKTNDRNVYDHV